MQKPRIDKIYLDMDGVIADFVKRYKEHAGMEPREAEKNKKFDHFFNEFIAKENFATLDMMPGAIDLINFLRSLPVPTEILSSTANEARYDAISKQKLQWLDSKGIDFKPNFVPGKRHKDKFATPNSIIIDDTLSVIEQWNAAGGIGIHHTDPVLTMAILKLYL
jgi:hypothetical protein